MWFTDLAETSTRVVLVVEATLFGLALVGVFGWFVGPLRWLARGLAALAVLIGVGTFVELVWEIWTLRPPLALPDAPFGTYLQPTLLRLLPLEPLLLVVGGVLAFRRPGPGGLLFVVLGVWDLLNVLNVFGIQDAASPPGTANVILVGSALPTLATGALLLSTWWAERRRHQRQISATRARPSPAAS
ncbi:MAG TPA: hypothetical protein VF937_03075 [Chloroflexota bacterium]